MSYKESDIVHENGAHWVLRDTRHKPPVYAVMVSGVTNSTSDSAYPLTEDGLSIAKARADYLARHSRARAAAKNAVFAERSRLAPATPPAYAAPQDMASAIDAAIEHGKFYTQAAQVALAGLTILRDQLAAEADTPNGK